MIFAGFPTDFFKSTINSIDQIIRDKASSFNEPVIKSLENTFFVHNKMNTYRFSYNEEKELLPEQPEDDL